MRRVHVLIGEKFKLSVDAETKCANLILVDSQLEYDQEAPDGSSQRRLDIDGEDLKEIAAFLDVVFP